MTVRLLSIVLGCLEVIGVKIGNNCLNQPCISKIKPNIALLGIFGYFYRIIFTQFDKFLHIDDL